MENPFEKGDFDDIEELGAVAKRVPAWIRGVCTIPPIILAVYWIYTGTGVYGWISDFQADIFDNEYYPVFSGLIAFIVPILPAAVIVQVLARTHYKDESEPK